MYLAVFNNKNTKKVFIHYEQTELKAWQWLVNHLHDNDYLFNSNDSRLSDWSEERWQQWKSDHQEVNKFCKEDFTVLNDPEKLEKIIDRYSYDLFPSDYSVEEIEVGDTLIAE